MKYQLNTSIRSYETMYKMHYKSGTHKAIDFDEFTDSKILHYIHILMQAHDGLFQKAMMDCFKRQQLFYQRSVFVKAAMQKDRRRLHKSRYLLQL